MKEDFNIVSLVNNDGCFDLQFRKDTRHQRTGKPTYYRWKTQFIVTSHKNNYDFLKKIKTAFNCGQIHLTSHQARFSVQGVDDICKVIIPYFKKNSLSGNKKKDFELWQKAVAIIQKNKGLSLIKWKKNEFLQLLEIHKSSLKYKENSREPKWLKTAKDLVKTI